jgi:hypothetical protein
VHAQAVGDVGRGESGVLVKELRDARRQLVARSSCTVHSTSCAGSGAGAAPCRPADPVREGPGRRTDTADRGRVVAPLVACKSRFTTDQEEAAFDHLRASAHEMPVLLQSALVRLEQARRENGAGGHAADSVRKAGAAHPRPPVPLRSPTVPRIPERGGPRLSTIDSDTCPVGGIHSTRHAMTQRSPAASSPRSQRRPFRGNRTRQRRHRPGDREGDRHEQPGLDDGVV